MCLCKCITVVSGFRTRTLSPFLSLQLHFHAFPISIFFTLFICGLIAMMQKSGGIAGFTQDFIKWATTSKRGQLIAYIFGLVIFFDDYANALIVGRAATPLTDMLSVSRQKIAFIVDSTSAPVASINPFSSWIGFEVGLIDIELSKLIDKYGEGSLRIQTTGLSVFLQALKYRYYPFFLLLLIPTLVLSGRDIGSMLIAERRTQVYKRKDGGDAQSKSDEGKELLGWQDDPTPDTPVKSWNFWFPIAILIFFLLYFYEVTGTDPSKHSQSYFDKMKNADSYTSLLWGTSATILVSQAFYMLQLKQNDKFVAPSPKVLGGVLSRFMDKLGFLTTGVTNGLEQEGEDQDVPKRLLTFDTGMKAFMSGMVRIVPTLAILIFAWATGSILVTIGADRLIAHYLAGAYGIAESLPTISFLASAFMALATGTSWGTMAIMFPLIVGPTYEASQGNPEIFYATLAGIQSGAVMGDHLSPISDTTILSALGTDCQLFAHVQTQAPYGFWIALCCVITGTLPIGYGAYPNIVAYLLGYLLILLFVFLLCKPIIDPEGRYDIFTELAMQCNSDQRLRKLQEDTRVAYIHLQQQLVQEKIERDTQKRMSRTVDSKGVNSEGSTEVINVNETCDSARVSKEESIGEGAKAYEEDDLFDIEIPNEEFSDAFRISMSKC